MTADRVSQFSLVVSSRDGTPPDPAAVEELADDLRAALTDAGAHRVEAAPVGPAPEGTRGVELLGAFTFIITAVQAGEALLKVVTAIRACVARFTGRRQRVRVTVAGTDFEIGPDTDVAPIVAALLAARGGRPTTARRSALVIANAHYDDPALAALRAPVRDADALAAVLGDPAIGGFDVDLLTDADERTVRRRVALFFADRERDDVLLLHFSCHGVKDPRGRLYLAASDTDLRTLGATGVAASFVSDQMAQTGSGQVVLVLDCCYSGAFHRGATARADRTVHIRDEFGTGAGRIVLTASSATEYAFEGGDLTRSEGDPSVFTTALVAGLASGDADLDGDGEITVDELYDYTYRQVRRRTPGQSPMKWIFGAEGSLTLARSVRPATLPPGVLADLDSDRVVLRLEAVTELRRILSGPGTALAARALVELSRLRDGDDSVRVRAAATEALETAGNLSPGTPRPSGAPDSARPAPAPRTPAAPAPVAGPEHAAAPDAPTPATETAGNDEVVRDGDTTGSGPAAGADPLGVPGSLRTSEDAAPSAPPHAARVGATAVPEENSSVGPAAGTNPVADKVAELFGAGGPDGAPSTTSTPPAAAHTVDSTGRGRTTSERPALGPREDTTGPRSAGNPLPTVARPTVLAVVVAATALAVVQLVQMVIVGHDVHGYAGLDSLAVVPVLAVVAVVSAARLREWRWVAGMATVLAVTASWRLFGLFDEFGPVDRGVGWGLIWFDGTAGTEGPGDFALRILLGAPAALWWAWAGPVGPARPHGWPRWARPVTRWPRRPALLATTSGAVLLALVMAEATAEDLSSTISFSLVRPVHRGANAVVGLGNVASGYSYYGANLWTTLWSVGWLVLMATGIVTAVTAARRRSPVWAGVVALPLLGSVALGLTWGGSYSYGSLDLFAQQLALIAGTASVGLLGYALFGPRPGPGARSGPDGD
ncbi:caspase, EACC1-associated type [Longispora urticae]